MLNYINMRTAIKDEFSPNLSFNEEIEYIKKSKFNAVFLTMRKKDKSKLSDEEIIKHAQMCKDCNLDIEFVHLPIEEELNDIWTEDERGDIYISNLFETIKKLSPYTKLFVMHVYYKNKIKSTTKVGIERLKKLGKNCNNIGVKIAVENVDNLILDYQTLKYLKDDENIGFCYDIGHKNFFGTYRNIEILELFKTKLWAVHIHDNDMKSDSHQLPYEQNFDKFGKLFKIIKEYMPIPCCTLEVTTKQDNIKLYLDEAYSILETIEKEY